MGNKLEKDIKRGRIFRVEIEGKLVGSEQGRVRPALVIQNDIGNMNSPTTIVVMLTKSMNKTPLPTHYFISNYAEKGLKFPSIVLCEQFKTLDKKRFKKYLGELLEDEMREIDRCLSISIGL